MSDRLLRTELEVELRSIDETNRSATFVATTERAVPMWDGPEVLRMAGVDLKRFKRNPVLLDSHDRSSIESVLGSAEVSVEGRKLISVNTYATTPRGEIAWQLVKGKHVRAMSIGYSVDMNKVKRLGVGESDGKAEDGSLVNGPATVVNRWTLLEVSNVPVPADQDAVRRAFLDSLPQEVPVSKTTDTLTAAMALGVAPAPGATTSTRADITPPAPIVPPPAPGAEAVRALEAHRRDVLAITPSGLEREAQDCILRGMTFDETRAALVSAQAKRFPPIGTPDAPAPKPDTRSAPLPDTVTDDVLVRSIQNLS